MRSYAGRIFVNAFKNPSFSIIFLFILLFSTGLMFGDRGWYEPDGIAILAGAVNLDLAKAGDFYLHGYFVQPFTYELNHAIYAFFDQGLILYILPAFFGALAVCFLVLAIYFFSDEKIGIFSGFLITLLFPELFFRLLYPSTSVFAFTCFSAALLILFSLRDRNGCFLDCLLLFFVGLLGAAACMFRFDFIFGLPLLLFLSARRSRSFGIFSVCISAVVLVFGISAVAGFFRPTEIMQYHDFHIAFFKALKWSKLQVFALLMGTANIIVWIFLLAHGVTFWWHSLWQKKWFHLFSIVPVFILFYPLKGGLNSSHYILPALCFCPFALVTAANNFSKNIFAKKIKASFGGCVKILVLLSIFLQFFSIEVAASFPFFYIGPHSSHVYTHDGRRAFGAYWRDYADVARSQYLPFWHGPLPLAHGLTDIIVQTKKNFTIVTANTEEENHLRALGVYCLPFFLQLRGYDLKYQNEIMIMQGSNNKVVIKNVPYADYLNLEAFVDEGQAVIKIPLVSRWAPDFKKQLQLFYQSAFAMR
jgi:hypothetical protein